MNWERAIFRTLRVAESVGGKAAVIFSHGELFSEKFIIHGFGKLPQIPPISGRLRVTDGSNLKSFFELASRRNKLKSS